MTENKKKKKFSWRRLIYNDKYLIIVSLLLAVVIWIITSLNIGTVESKTLKITVPITLGDEVSEQLGMQYYSLQDSIDLNVTVSGAKYVVGQVSQDDLNITFDTSSVNRTGEQTIPILVTNSSSRLDFDVTATYPSSIEGYFDVNASKVFDVNLNYDESVVADNYVFGTPVMSADKVIVSGPKTYVDKVDSIDVNVDFGDTKDITEMYTADCQMQIEGSGVETSYLKITSRSDTQTQIDTIAVTLPILKETNLPVAVDFENKPRGLDSGIVDVSYSMNKVNAGVLDSANINSAVVGTIDFSKLTVGKQKFDFDVTSLNGIKILDDTKTITATVKVSSQYDEKSISINKNDVVVEGVPKGYKANVKSISSSYITVVAPNSSTFTSSDLTIKCDVSEQNDDKKYIADITVNDNQSWIYGTYTVTVELVKE